MHHDGLRLAAYACLHRSGRGMERGSRAMILVVTNQEGQALAAEVIL
mgnify:CR=1